MRKYGLKSSNYSISTLKSNVNQERTGVFMKQVIIEMMEAVKGGHAAVAGFLCLTPTQFNNRLYQSNGQRFKDEELIAVENEFGVHHWSEEIARLTGGTKVKQEAVSALDTVELFMLQSQQAASRGQLAEIIHQAMLDGVIEPHEEARIMKAMNVAHRDDFQATAAIITLYRA